MEYLYFDESGKFKVHVPDVLFPPVSMQSGGMNDKLNLLQTDPTIIQQEPVKKRSFSFCKVLSPDIDNTKSAPMPLVPFKKLQ